MKNIVKNAALASLVAIAFVFAVPSDSFAADPKGKCVVTFKQKPTSKRSSTAGGKDMTKAECERILKLKKAIDPDATMDWTPNKPVGGGSPTAEKDSEF